MNLTCYKNEKEHMDPLPKEELVEAYLKQLSEVEKIAYHIAKKNLESSFDVEKSIGFLEYLKQSGTFK